MKYPQSTVTHTMKYAFIAIALCCYGSQVRANDEYGQVPLSTLYTMYAEYLESSEQESLGFYMLYTIKANESAPEDVIMHFEFDGQRFTITPNKDGTLNFKPNQAMLEKNPMVVTNQPKGTMSTDISVGVNLPLTTELPIEIARQVTHSAWTKAKRFGGVLSFFAPKYASLVPVFGPECPEKTLSIIDDQGKTLTRPSNATSVIDFSNKHVRRAKSILFSCVPKAYLIEAG